MTRRRTGPNQKARDAAFQRDGGCIICGDTYDLHLHPRLTGERAWVHADPRWLS